VIGGGTTESMDVGNIPLTQFLRTGDTELLEAVESRYEIFQGGRGSEGCSAKEFHRTCRSLNLIRLRINDETASSMYMPLSRTHEGIGNNSESSS
jgi:hypothetical protein